jgi:hypothetical protein
VAVKCASLFSDAVASALIDAPVDHHRDETTQKVDITDITARQYGSLDCLWGAEPQDGGYVYDLTVDITPDAAAGFTVNLANFAEEDPPVSHNTAGDQSVSGCAGGGSLSCMGNMLVGTYWVTANLQDIVTTSMPQATATARIQHVLTMVAAVLKNTKAGKAWTPRGGALPGFCSAAGSTAQVNSAVGASDFAAVGEDAGEADAASYTQKPGVYTQCTWGSASSPGPFSYVSIGMLRGGAWVLPQLPGETNTKSYMLAAYTSITIPGATSAAGNCSVAADQCEVAVAIGSLLVVIGTDDPSDAQSMAVLATIVAAIRAS